jgi:hypothetical protein
MKFRLYREYGALNSPLVFDAFEQGLKNLGLKVDQDRNNIPIIWSVLWNGRMKPNQLIYNDSVNKNIPVIIIEVGNLKRGNTWRISVNNVNRLGYFGEGRIDQDRPRKLGIDLKPSNQNRRPEILIACQHRQSLQWPSTSSIERWVEETISQIEAKTDRKIVVRPHPRCPINLSNKTITVNNPRKIINSYDDFDFDYSYHTVINYNTGPSIIAAINGTPVICDESALAFPVSDLMENIENPQLKNREEWLIDLSHKEWTVDEIASGIPQKRISSYLESMIS